MAHVTDLAEIEDRLIASWNAQDVEAVVACYSDDVRYVDPNTRGAVEGADAMRRYLTKLFARWEMHWTIKERFPLSGVHGAAALWRASFRVPGDSRSVAVDGMDLVVIEGDRVKRNEVYFDRAALAALLEPPRPAGAV